MSTTLPNTRIDAHDAPPPYHEAASNPAAKVLAENIPPPHNSEVEDDSPQNSEPPPPFMVTPGTLFLYPDDDQHIHSTATGGRPLYLLSKPLNGHVMSVTLIDVPESGPFGLDSDDPPFNVWRVPEKDKLYRIYEHFDSANLSAQVAAVSAQKPRQFHGVRLKKSSSIGLTGSLESFDATCGDEMSMKILYQAQQNKGVLEWREGTGRLVAIDNVARDRKAQEESLDILVSLDKKHLDLMAALWIARIWHNSQAEGKKEDRRLARQRKAEHTKLCKKEGRPHGLLHEMKEALGIGYGVKGPSNGIFPGGMPATNQNLNGRINWGASKR